MYSKELQVYLGNYNMTFIIRLHVYASHNAGAVGSPAAPCGALGSPDLCALLIGLANKSRGVEVVHYVR